MPTVFGKENKKKELVASLGDIYKRIEREHQISPGDFPNLKKMQVSKKEQRSSHSQMMCRFYDKLLFVFPSRTSSKLTISPSSSL